MGPRTRSFDLRSQAQQDGLMHRTGDELDSHGQAPSGARS